MFAPESVRVPLPLFVNPPEPLPITPEIVVLPVPAIVNKLAPFVIGTLTENRLAELLVQVCAAVIIVSFVPLSVKPAPLFMVIPPPEMLIVEPLPELSVIVMAPSSTVMLLAN